MTPAPPLRVTLTDDAQGVRLAARLLDRGVAVAVITEHAAPYAMLVNRHGDLVEMIELDARSGCTVDDALHYLDGHGIEADALLVVRSGGWRSHIYRGPTMGG
ncbi:hypothetical protein [Microbacterium album]|uniref:Uncharacterized protein n=1 Tax=Microbacterium album TaxID=2053191 RepID=A0A917IDI7_9MICO|nr:hypothetical protein [Microbacterium album]GGH41955.1 hypothetical protein GCM10010921_14860 [Microbacterium album]